MRYRSHTVPLLALLAAAALTLPTLAEGPVGERPAGYQAITKPSKDRTISFYRPGRVVEVLVSKGDEVKTGQLIARQDDTEEQAALAIDKSASEDVTEIDAEQTVRAEDVIDYERMKTSSPSQQEIDKAKLEVSLAEARIQIAKTKNEQAVLKYHQSQIAVDKLKVLAPIDGVIAEEFLQKGESADNGNMKLVRIVQLDPLWVEVPVPILQARKLKKEDAATVSTPDGKQRQGKVAVVSPVADSASDTILVRLEVPNPEKTPAGDTVFVTFGPPAPVQVGAAQSPIPQ